MPLEGQIRKEDQAAKHSTEKKTLVPYEIESSGPEGKDFSDVNLNFIFIIFY